MVRTLNPHQIFIERIHRDNGFWDISMLTKLESFYNKVLLPELASPREGQRPGIREPGIWVRLQIYKYKSGACFVTCKCICIIFFICQSTKYYNFISQKDKLRYVQVLCGFAFLFILSKIYRIHVFYQVQCMYMYT